MPRDIVSLSLPFLDLQRACKFLLIKKSRQEKQIESPRQPGPQACQLTKLETDLVHGSPEFGHWC